MRRIYAMVIFLVLGTGFLSAGGASESEEPKSSNAPAESAQMAGSTRSVEGGSYIDYSPELFASASELRRVYFFHASWCPTCRSADRAFFDAADRIPDDVVLFKIDYDSSDQLKRKFGVTFQHTFVLVDSDGEQVAIWNGGDIERLIQNTL